MTTTTDIDELTRLWRELTGLHNGMFEIDDEIKSATNNDKEVARKIAKVYSAIEALQDEIEEYRKKTE